MEDRFWFRVWEKRYKKMLGPWDIDDFEMPYTGGDSPSSFPHKRAGKSRWHDSIMMQCTGLKDKNGKLIYEGDLLKASYAKVGAVYWDEVIAAFAWDGGLEWGMISSATVEIIGNIYESPELLK